MDANGPFAYVISFYAGVYLFRFRSLGGDHRWTTLCPRVWGGPERWQHVTATRSEDRICFPSSATSCKSSDIATSRLIFHTLWIFVNTSKPTAGLLDSHILTYCIYISCPFISNIAWFERLFPMRLFFCHMPHLAWLALEAMSWRIGSSSLVVCCTGQVLVLRIASHPQWKHQSSHWEQPLHS